MQKLILYKIPESIHDELLKMYQAEQWSAIIQLLNQHRVAHNHPMCNSCLESYYVVKRDLPNLWQNQESL